MKKITTNEKLEVLLELGLDSSDKETIIDAVRNNRSSLQVEHEFTHKVLIFVIVASSVAAIASIITLSMA